ncbi:hypothetical protein MWU59_00130 [Flavobacteriaceae bacterium F08102]|nr:hypothetical protein [Flavobacteriaceae bacterium F08102]
MDLKIYTNNGNLKITAKSLKIGKDHKTIQNPIKDKKSTTAEKYIQTYNLEQTNLSALLILQTPEALFKLDL